MKHLRDENLSPNIETPDAPYVHDVVRVYADSESEFYILGKVLHFDDSDAQTYTIQYIDKAGYTTEIKAYYDRVELETPWQEVERRKKLHGTKHNRFLESNSIDPA